MAKFLDKLKIQQSPSALTMADTIYGDGVTVVNASFTGDKRSAGIYSDADANAPGISVTDSGLILSTGHAMNFRNEGGPGGRHQQGSTDTKDGVDNDPWFNAAAGAPTYDATYLDSDIIPQGDTLTMSFVFASEEYPDYVGTNFNDIVGIWVNGQQVQLTVGTGDTSVGAINPINNTSLYVDNQSGAYDTAMDGFTITLSVTLNVIPNQVNSIRIGIADVADTALDSAILIAADSIQPGFVAVDDALSLSANATQSIDVLANDDYSGPGTLTITHINSQPVVTGSSITLAGGQTVTVNPDGTLSVTASAATGPAYISYTAESSEGYLSSAFITLDTVPCFVAGTLIRVPSGEQPVETLEPGDLVTTRDDGDQPLRWIGTRRIEATGPGAPIRFKAGALGSHRTLMVSPLHRILIRDVLAEVLFGTGEVLVAARDLVNGDTIRAVEGGHVTYVHLLFDRHQVVFSEGLESESFLPGSQTAQCYPPEVLAGIRDALPGVDPLTGQGYPPAARRTLRRFEAELLINGGRAA